MQETVQSRGRGCLACSAACGCASRCSPWSCACPSCSGPCCRSARGRRRTPGRSRRRSTASNALIGGHKAKERVLTTDISRQTSRINAPAGGHHAALGAASSSCRRASTPSARELAVVQRKLRQERARLDPAARPPAGGPPRARPAPGRALQGRRARRGHASCSSPTASPTCSTRTEFMERVSARTRRSWTIVADAKADATATAKRLDKLEKPRRKVAKADRAPARRGLHRPRRPRRPPRPHPDRARATRRPLLASSRDRRHELEDDVAASQTQQAKIQAKLAGYSGGRSRAGPVKPGSGGLIWPVNGPITSPFCESRAWESCHPGIDIGVPAGTPIRAAAAGKVVLMQAGRRPAATATSPASSTPASLSTCYAHQSRFGTSMGAQVSQGQVIGYVGLHRPLLRGPSAFRDPDQRLRGQPHELPLGALVAACTWINLFGLTIQSSASASGVAFLVAGWMVAPAPEGARPQRGLRLRDGLRRADRRDRRRKLWYIAENGGSCWPLFRHRARLLRRPDRRRARGIAWAATAASSTCSSPTSSRPRSPRPTRSGAIGCQLAGDGDYGKDWDGPWAMAYPNGTVPTTATRPPHADLRDPRDGRLRARCCGAGATAGGRAR